MNIARTLVLSALLLLSLSISEHAVAQEPVCNADVTPSAQLNECNTYWEFLTNWTCIYDYLEQLLENSQPLPYLESKAIDNFLEDTCDLILD